ncbi:MAG: hypothetical protein QOJ15_6044 [Bradyrhizobium sp.]|nr:hypothetical protein [Bradyrhizobium sp.]
MKQAIEEAAIVAHLDTGKPPALAADRPRLKSGVYRRLTIGAKYIRNHSWSKCMAITRWTIRGIEHAVIEQVRAARRRTGFRLGRIVSAAIRLGMPTALAELREQAPSPRQSSARGFFAVLVEMSKAFPR